MWSFACGQIKGIVEGGNYHASTCTPLHQRCQKYGYGKAGVEALKAFLESTSRSDIFHYVRGLFGLCKEYIIHHGLFSFIQNAPVFSPFKVYLPTFIFLQKKV